MTDSDYQLIEGNIGSVTVEVTVEGDEDLAEMIYFDLVGRAQELRQMVEEDIHPDATEPTYHVPWEDLYKEVPDDD